jgi:hypothetical protein
MNGVKIDLNLPAPRSSRGTSGDHRSFHRHRQMKASLHNNFPNDFTENFDELDAVADNITFAPRNRFSHGIYRHCGQRIERLKVSNAEGVRM